MEIDKNGCPFFVSKSLTKETMMFIMEGNRDIDQGGQGIKMVDMNIIIANNINIFLEKNQRKQVELAGYLHVSRQIVSKMLSGARTINAGELRQIAEFCGTSMEELTSVPQDYEETDVFHVFMGKVKSKEAQQSIQDIDTVIDLILFHDRVRENGAAMGEERMEF